eukprot:4671317-Lingulodinium_polyedra.AAC.1
MRPNGGGTKSQRCARRSPPPPWRGNKHLVRARNKFMLPGRGRITPSSSPPWLQLSRPPTPG